MIDISRKLNTQDLILFLTGFEENSPDINRSRFATAVYIQIKNRRAALFYHKMWEYWTVFTSAWKEATVTQSSRRKKQKHFENNSENLYIRTVFLWISPV